MAIGAQTRLKQVYSGTCLANKKFMQKIEKILSISASEKATYRIQVIEFHDKYGTEATKDAFGVSKTTIYRWRQVYLKSRKDASVLIPISNRPKNIRVMKTDHRIIQFIKEQRKEHRRIGKEKLKPLLDAFCEQEGIASVSEATIGRIITRYHLFFQKKGRIYHDPSRNHTTKRVSYKSRIKHSPHESKPGYIEIDTITRYHQGKKVYVMNGVDVYTRFSFAYAYTTLTSTNGADYLKRLASLYPYHSVQTDNGLEFHGKFHEYLEKHNIAHHFTYPRCPRINGFVERANRSLSEEFLEDHLCDMGDIMLFNAPLHKHTIWYNTKRIHRGLKNKTPSEFLKQCT